MQYRYSEQDFPIAVKHLIHNPKILTLFSDEDAVEDYSPTGKIDDKFYTRHIKVDDLAARQRIVCALYYARHSDIPREIAEIIISVMNFRDWKLNLELSKEERDNNPLPKHKISQNVWVRAWGILFIILVIFLVTQKSFPPLEAVFIMVIITLITYFYIRSSFLKQYNFDKERRKAKREEKRLNILESNNQLLENQALKTMLENTQGYKYSKYTFQAENVQIIENTNGGDVVVHKYSPLQRQLVEDANEFLQQLEQLSPAYPTFSEAQHQAIINKTIERIKRDKPTAWQRLHSAGKTALIEVFKEICDRPIVNVIVETIKSYRNPE